jgi:hypothetical protein
VVALPFLASQVVALPFPFLASQVVALPFPFLASQVVALQSRPLFPTPTLHHS